MIKYWNEVGWRVEQIPSAIRRLPNLISVTTSEEIQNLFIARYSEEPFVLYKSPLCSSDVLILTGSQMNIHKTWQAIRFRLITYSINSDVSQCMQLK